MEGNCCGLMMHRIKQLLRVLFLLAFGAFLNLNFICLLPSFGPWAVLTEEKLHSKYWFNPTVYKVASFGRPCCKII